ncbi:MAG TPA: DUF5808 domain-containing protein [Bacillales bacterium]
MAYVFMLVSFIPVVFISVCIPYVTRRTESFGVSIPEEVYHSIELKKMRKRYSWQTALFGAAVMILWWAATTMFFSVESPVFLIALFVFMIGSFMIYLVYHGRMKSMKEKEKWHEAVSEVVAVDTGFRNRKITISLGWYAVPLGVALATLIFTMIFYDRMPGRIPMQYDFDGNVTRWVNKSYRTVLSFPILQLFIVALFLFVHSIIAKSKQQIDPANPEQSARQNQTFRQRWSVFNFISGTAVVLMFSFTQLSFFISIPANVQMVVSLVVVGCIIVGVIVLSFTTGQGGSRVRTGQGKRGEVINRDDDRYWKLGQFYFNPNDPAIWVEKRFGIGWTVNFAHPAGWGSLAAIILIAILLPILTSS